MNEPLSREEYQRRIASLDLGFGQRAAGASRGDRRLQAQHTWRDCQIRASGRTAAATISSTPVNRSTASTAGTLNFRNSYSAQLQLGSRYSDQMISSAAISSFATKER